MLFPLMVLLPFTIYLFFPLLLLLFIGPALLFAAPLTLTLLVTLEDFKGPYLMIIYIVYYISGILALILVTASYFLYRGALKCMESRRWLIVLPIIWAYPIPIMAYTVVTHYEYFLKALMGDKEVFGGYHFPGAWGMLLLLIFIGLIIAIVYATINIYVHIKLVRHHYICKEQSISRPTTTTYQKKGVEQIHKGAEEKILEVFRNA
ncbi:hypothetical protein J4526_08980 [Desulfurococcaceae archaeon MEX13E-LK6-19]|nr:hypothetical protein J4526_08980 [Desulfurococcaceae archaeon MEX13E-LK6-19]